MLEVLAFDISTRKPVQGAEVSIYLINVVMVSSGEDLEGDDDKIFIEQERKDKIRELEKLKKIDTVYTRKESLRADAYAAAISTSFSTSAPVSARKFSIPRPLSVPKHFKESSLTSVYCEESSSYSRMRSPSTVFSRENSFNNTSSRSKFLPSATVPITFPIPLASPASRPYSAPSSHFLSASTPLLLPLLSTPPLTLPLSVIVLPDTDNDTGTDNEWYVQTAATTVSTENREQEEEAEDEEQEQDEEEGREREKNYFYNSGNKSDNDSDSASEIQNRNADAYKFEKLKRNRNKQEIFQNFQHGNENMKINRDHVLLLNSAGGSTSHSSPFHWNQSPHTPYTDTDTEEFKRFSRPSSPMKSRRPLSALGERKIFQEDNRPMTSNPYFSQKKLIEITDLAAVRLLKAKEKTILDLETKKLRKERILKKFVPTARSQTLDNVRTWTKNDVLSWFREFGASDGVIENALFAGVIDGPSFSSECS